MPAIHISLSAETLFRLGDVLPVSNSLLTTWLVMGCFAIVSFLATRKLLLVPGRFQSVAEIVVESLFSLFSAVLHEHVHRFFTVLATLFLFILTLNWAGLLPGVGTIGIWRMEGQARELIPLFRSGTADLNTTIALALIAVLLIQLSGFVTLKTAYLTKFINVTNPIYFFVGILDIISEFSKIISFAFRLFGNVFAGEVLLTVIAVLMPLFAPLPFLGLELFVGFIQALVFSMLTAVFLSVAVTKSSH